jgi:hypothetical protein
MNWNTQTAEQKVDAVKRVYRHGMTKHVIAAQLGTTYRAIEGAYRRNPVLAIDCPLRLPTEASAPKRAKRAAFQALLDKTPDVRAALAKELGLDMSAPYQWHRAPAEHVKAISRHTGIPKHELRPDIYDKGD